MINVQTQRVFHPSPVDVAAIRPAQATALPDAVPRLLFAAKDMYVSNKNRHILLPAGTPLFFLHGTSSTGERLQPTIDYFRNKLATKHPTYVGYLPEVKNATGIEQSLNANTLPAYLAVWRLSLPGGS